MSWKNWFLTENFHKIELRGSRWVQKWCYLPNPVCRGWDPKIVMFRLRTHLIGQWLLVIILTVNGNVRFSLSVWDASSTSLSALTHSLPLAHSLITRSLPLTHTHIICDVQSSWRLWLYSVQSPWRLWLYSVQSVQRPIFASCCVYRCGKKSLQCGKKSLQCTQQACESEWVGVRVGVRVTIWFIVHRSTTMSNVIWVYIKRDNRWFVWSISRVHYQTCLIKQCYCIVMHLFYNIPFMCWTKKQFMNKSSKYRNSLKLIK